MSKDQEDRKKEEMKVVDRRRFDASGNDRAESHEVVSSPSASSTVTPPKSVSNSSAPKGAAKVDDSEMEKHRAAARTEYAEHQAPEIDFSAFMMSLATQALMQLGEVKPPEGVDLKPDVVAARQTIDIIAMIQAKTKGNLDERESHLMESILHNLRISFLRAAKK